MGNCEYCNQVSVEWEMLDVSYAEDAHWPPYSLLCALGSAWDCAQGAGAASDQVLHQVLGPLTGSRSQQTFSLEALTGGWCPQGPHGASGPGILKSNIDKRSWFEFGWSLDAEGILRAQQIWMCVAFFSFSHLEKMS